MRIAPSLRKLYRVMSVLLGMTAAGCGEDEAAPSTTPGRDLAVDGAPAAEAANDAGTETGSETGWILLESCDGPGDLAIQWLGEHGCRAPALASPAGGRALHLQGPASAQGGELGTYHHIDWTASFQAMRFWARSAGPEPGEIIVAFTALMDAGRNDLFSDEKAGRTWQGKRVALGPHWQLHTVRLDELAPLTPGLDVVPVYGSSGGGGSEIHLVAPADRGFDLWVDDVALACRTTPCR